MLATSRAHTHTRAHTQFAAAAVVSSDGRDLYHLSDYTLFWAGNFSADEVLCLWLNMA